MMPFSRNANVPKFLLAAALFAAVQGSADAQNPRTPSKRCYPEYPKQALRAGEEGMTLAAFRVAPDGSVPNVVIMNSSGSISLDQAVVAVLSQCVFKPPAHPQIGPWQIVTYNWFMEGTAPLASPVANRLRLASEAGDAAASFHLSLIMETYGKSDDDVQQAQSLLERAAAGGLAHAQYELGRRYENGIRRDVDLVKAEYWYRKAAAQGEELAVERLKH